MPYAFSLLIALPGFVLCLLASGAEDVAAVNEELVELRRLAEQGDAEAQNKPGRLRFRQPDGAAAMFRTPVPLPNFT